MECPKPVLLFSGSHPSDRRSYLINLKVKKLMEELKEMHESAEFNIKTSKENFKMDSGENFHDLENRHQ